MLLKGRGPRGPFTHRISRKKFDALLVWLTPTKDGNEARRPWLGKDGRCTASCRFFSASRYYSCGGCLLDKQFAGGCDSGECFGIQRAARLQNARILRNARRRLRAMAKRGEEA